MKIICAWCKRDLGEKESSAFSECVISHGICDECKENQNAPYSTTLREFLNTMELPVFAVDDDATILIANNASVKALGKKAEDLEMHKGGVAMECQYASLPGGCGNTHHCKGCTIRNNVTETFETGISKKHVPAYLEQGTEGAVQKLELLISTEKVGNVVLLRIDKISM